MSKYNKYQQKAFALQKTKAEFFENTLLLNERLIGCGYVKEGYDHNITPTQLNLIFYFFYESKKQIHKMYKGDIEYIKNGVIPKGLLTTALDDFQTKIDIDDFQHIFGGCKQSILQAIRDLKTIDIVTNMLEHGQTKLVPAQIYSKKVLLDSHIGKNSYIQMDSTILMEVLWHYDSFCIIELETFASYENSFQKLMYIILENRARMPYVTTVKYRLEQWFDACNISTQQPLYSSILKKLLINNWVFSNVELTDFNQSKDNQCNKYVEITFKRKA